MSYRYNWIATHFGKYQLGKKKKKVRQYDNGVFLNLIYS